MPAWYENNPTTPAPTTGPGPPQPQAPPLATDFQGHAGQVLGGRFLDSGNPHLKGVMDAMRRQADESYAGERARLGGQSEAAGAFYGGGDVWQSVQGRAFNRYQQDLAEQQNQVQYQNYGDERNRMMEALGMSGQFETAADDRQAQQSMHAGSLSNNLQLGELQAQLQRDLQTGNLDFGRQQLALDTMNSMSSNQINEGRFLSDLAMQQYGMDQGMMNLAGGMGSQAGQQDLAMMGMIPGLEQAGYYGYNQAMQGQGAVDSQDSAAAARRAQIDSQNAQNQWQHNAYNEQNALNDYVRNLLGLAGVGGSTASSGFGTRTHQQQPQQDPLMAGLIGGAAAGFQGYAAAKQQTPPPNQVAAGNFFGNNFP